MSKVYVGNLPFEHDPRDLEDEFAKFGRIEQCAVKRGFAFIHYDSPGAAEDAVKEMEGREWQGRRLRVALSTSSNDNSDRNRGGSSGGADRMQERGGRDSNRDGQVSKNLFVANIAPTVRLSELEEFFEKYGTVGNVKILPQARGNVAMSAFVDFDDVAAAEKAHNSELMLGGLRLRTDYNFPREPRDGGSGDRERRHGDDNHSSRGRRDSFDAPPSRSRVDRSDNYGSGHHSEERRARSRSRSREKRNSDQYERYPRQVEDKDSYRSRDHARTRSRSPRRQNPRDDREVEHGSGRERYESPRRNGRHGHSPR